MRWVNNAGNDKRFLMLNYIDRAGNIFGSVDIDHIAKKITWYVNGSNGPGRNVGHAKKVVEKSAKR